tara:strand:+ start:307 stop:426 length:120 start_codon:yes stop_codon:yes gene_type:complete
MYKKIRKIEIIAVFVGMKKKIKRLVIIKRYKKLDKTKIL